MSVAEGSPKNQHFKQLRPWLEEKLDSGQFPCLSWVDKELGKFQITWQGRPAFVAEEDGGEPGCSENDGGLDELCRDWARKTGQPNDTHAARKNTPWISCIAFLLCHKRKEPSEDRVFEGGEMGTLRQALALSRDIAEMPGQTGEQSRMYMFVKKEGPAGPEEVNSDPIAASRPDDIWYIPLEADDICEVSLEAAPLCLEKVNPDPVAAPLPDADVPPLPHPPPPPPEPRA